MALLSRTIFLEISTSALLGSALFLLIIFLQQASRLFSILVNSAASAGTVGYLFLLLIPASLPYTVPLGALAGTLIALSRMSNDGEIIALRASGIPSRRVARPVTLFALLATAITGYCSIKLTPWCQAEVVRVLNRVGPSQLTAEIMPRVFDESFPNTILFVNDVLTGRPVHWKGVFIADTTPPDQRKSAAVDRGEGPRLTLARDALVMPDNRGNRLQLSLSRESGYEVAPDAATYYHINAPRGEMALEAQDRGPQRKAAVNAMSTTTLAHEARTSVEAAIELHRRLALPLACLLLALTGVPLGVSSRKGGKSAAFAITVFLAFLYYTVLLGLIGLAKDGRLKPALAVWTPNALFALLALILLSRLEFPEGRERFGLLRARLFAAWRRLRRILTRGPEAPVWARTLPRTRFFLLPQIIDTYVLSSFLFYFALLVGGFVVLTEVFNFFELLADVFKNNIPMGELLRYFLYLTPKLIYETSPVGVLVASLVTFGILAKNNEIIALKACGVSLYRLTTPLLVTTLIMSGALFLFDQSVVTPANIVQENLRNKIRGHAAQTYLNPQRKWICGDTAPLFRIFYYKHFDQDQGVLGGVQVYDIDFSVPRLVRHLLAERAHWEPTLNTWVFENGWVREFGAETDKYRPFAGSAATFQDVTEPPGWFRKEVKTYRQLTFTQLRDYIAELQRSGFNTVPLQVQYHKKFAVPLFVFVMALISVPFAFMTGSRGAMTGVGVSLGVAAAYFVLNYLFEQLGGAGQLPPVVAAWAPDGIFALAGLYLMMQMRT